MVELNDRPGVEKLARGHKKLKGVPLHKPHGIYELGIGNKSWKILICFTIHFPGTSIRIACNMATMEDGTPDNRSTRLIWGEVITSSLNRWEMGLLGSRTG